MKPIPTVHPHLFPLGLATVPSKPLKLPPVRIFQPDELQTFKSTFEIRSFADVTRHIKQSKEYRDLQLRITNDCITGYRVVISSGVATVKSAFMLTAICMSNSAIKIVQFLYLYIFIEQKDPS